MVNELNNDRPISSVKDDRFNRAEFAKKVAGLCFSHTPESRVIGLYGRWGDGKSSLLNMVNNSLDPDVIKVHFNPWIFKDENELLLAFFQLFAEKLGGSLELKKEKIRNAIVDYGETIGVFGVYAKAAPIVLAGTSLLKLFKKPKPLSSDKAKQRVVDLIVNSRVNIAVFIDDIDRLDNREVAAVFKLVKLLADFPRTTYLLSFDHEVVAKMLAPHYGGAAIEFGYQYLEKVIQLPLAIPMAHNDSILHFLNESLLQISIDNKLNLEMEGEKLVEYFADGLLTLLDNPRKIIRLCNSLRFTISILKGEANIFDIIVIETFKITAPEFYFFIRNQKYLMTDDYLEPGPEYSSMREDAAKKIAPFIKLYPQHYKEALRTLTCNLFPKFAWQDPAESKGYNKDDLILARRICVPEYFERYFTFSLMEDEISDVHFSNTYVDQNNHSENEILNQLKSDIKKFTFESIAYKMSRHRNEIKGQAAERLIGILCKISDEFEENSGSIASPFRMMVITVENVIKGLPKEKQFQSVLHAVDSAANLNFAADIVARFVMPESKENPGTYFSGQRAIEIKEVYLKKLRTKIDELGFFNAIAESRMARQLVWWNDVNDIGLREQVDDVLSSIPEAPIKFLRIFTPTVNSMNDKGETKEIKANLQEEQYILLDRIIGAQKVLDYLKYSHFKSLENYDWSKRPGLNEELDNEEIVRMFNFLQKLKLKEANAIGNDSGLLRKDD